MQTQTTALYSNVLPSNSILSNNNIQPVFQLESSPVRKKRWLCHVSSTTKLKSKSKLVLNVKPTSSLNSFDVIERLLFAKTCELIYSDDTFPLHQVKMLKQMAMFSGTEIVFIADKIAFNNESMTELEKA